ncbi:MAG: PA0069 family radical SAM protein [Candidatus Krumholzibacteriota bacterium]|nr:PA0069 family radical SAM protein [Candidatus Krumholzibacteriota bacterium]
MEKRQPIQGRGASTNPVNRFEHIEYVPDPDVPRDESPRPRTEFLVDRSRSLLTTNDSPDVRFNVGINPYRGCEHGCVYCYARPYHEYLGFSAGLDFETKILVKRDAPELLRRELSQPSWKPQPIGLCGATDAYQPIERQLRITRGCLEVITEYRNPVIVITKNHLVTRDIDLLSELAAVKAVSVFVSVTTLDPALVRIMEPRTSSPRRRLDAIEALSRAGIPVGVLVAPIIPALTDHEIPDILAACAEAGAQYAGWIVLRLPGAVAKIFENWLDEHYAERKGKVLSRMRSLRGGKLYDSEYRTRMKGEGPFAERN